MQERVDTLVVSDVHLGSKLSESDALMAALERFTFDRLILNGDIFDHLNFEPRVSQRAANRVRFARHGRFEQKHLHVLEYLHALSARCEVIWIEGNHDEGLADILRNFGGIRVYQEYEWSYKGERYLALHGDQFDHFYQEHPILSDIGAGIYDFIQNLGPHTQRLCWFLKRNTKRYIHALTLVGDGAIAYARERGIGHVLCGHTHQAEQRQKDGVHYHNSGSWTQIPSTLLSVGENGVKVHSFGDGPHLI